MSTEPPVQTPHDTEELPVILRLLDEYSGKLQMAERALDRLEVVGAVQGLSVVLPILGSIIGLFWAIEGQKGPIAITLFTLLLVLALAMTPFLVRTAHHDRLQRNQLRVTKRLLERLIKMASQAAEHQRMTVGQRLELEVRLAETESALELADRRITSPMARAIKSLPFPFPR